MGSEQVIANLPWRLSLKFDVHAILIAVRARLIYILPVIIVPLLVLIYLFTISRSLNRLPSSLPWMNRRPKEMFSTVRACLRQYGSGFDDLREASEEYGKRGLSFVFPQPNFRPVVIVPMEHLRWMLKQPENVLSARVALSEQAGIPDVLPCVTVPAMHKLGGFMINTLKSNSQYKINQAQESLLDEISHVLDGTLGHDTESWKTICVSELMTKVTAHTGARVLTDKSLSRDESFTKACDRCGILFGIMSVVVGSYSPPIIRTILSAPFRFPMAYLFDRCVKSIMPLVEERWNFVQNSNEKEPSAGELQEDLMTWSIKAAQAGKYQGLATLERLAKVLMLFSIAASGTSAMTSTHALLDLLLSDRQNYEKLQEEAITAFEAHQKGSLTCMLPQLVGADSAIRESMRHHPLFVPFPCMKVMSAEGITIPTGEHLPQGTYIGTPTFRVHMDPKTYPDPENYHPFRFVQASPSTVAESAEDTQTPVPKIETGISASTVSDTFLSFGAGRHTCPGRWIATAQMKLIIAYMLAHYDIKPLTERLPNRRMGQAEVPSLSATIEIRRRRGV